MTKDLRVKDIEWDSNPSTRESTHIYTKSEPVNVELTTPGTAQNLWLRDKTPATVNLVTNPSFETGDPPTSIVAVNATLAQDATYYKYGTKSMKITPNNSAAGEGAYYSLGVISCQDPVSVSVYFTRGVGSGDDAKIAIYGVTSAAILATGNTITLGNTWLRSVATLLGERRETEELRVYMITASKHATVFYCDGLQAELLTAPTSYCDGAQGYYNIWGEWKTDRWVEGVAHQSVSFREPALKEVRAYRLFTTRDCYVAFDRMATSTTGEFLKAGTDFWEDHPIRIFEKISFINVYAGEKPRIYGRVYGI